MSIKTFLIKTEESIVADLKAAGHAIEEIVVTDTQAFVAQVKQLPIATEALNLVELLTSSSSLSGDSKLSAVAGVLGSAVATLKASGGFSGIVASVEALAREAAQSIYVDAQAAIAKVASKTA